ncbi:MAG TPA: hypothetical protein VHQ65_10935 [Thermoanaerobaculia bacterium]|nr:hypothetical protein [Thermoanaerobaculia bacterium]
MRLSPSPALAVPFLLALALLGSAGRVQAAESCTPDARTLCLEEGRFRVVVDWQAPDGSRGAARAVTGSDDSGLFWFFAPANWEMLVKVLDGCGVNGHRWVFAAATTNVGYTLQVTDTVTGARSDYQNPVGSTSPAITDTEAFPCSPATARATRADLTASHGGLAGVAGLRSPSETGCVAGPSVLCLQNGRFEVEVDWEDFAGNQGRGNVAPLATADSGLFWFFDGDNWEMLIKVLDGCGVNDRFWVFAAATTTVGYTVRVTDTHTGLERFYGNPRGQAATALTDTGAFATCTVDPSLPPDPGTAGRSTVRGIDADSDGLRDDVQRYLALTYPDAPAQRLALRQSAEALENALSAASTGQSLAEATAVTRALECLWAVSDTRSGDHAAALLSILVDTPQRFQAYLTWNRRIAGQVFPARGLEDAGTSCEAAGLAAESATSSAGALVGAAQSCTAATSSVYFANGVWNDFTSAQRSLQELQVHLGSRMPAETEYALAYNPTDGYVADVWEAVRQDVRHGVSQFFRMLHGLLPMSADVRDELVALTARLDEGAVLSSSVLQNHLNLYRGAMLEGKKVVVVAHSQGNYFANAAYHGLSANEQGSLGIVAVASPVIAVAGGGPWVTLVNDLVVTPLRATPFTANTVNGLPDLADLSGHQFVASYLKAGSSSEAKILAGVVALDGRLVQPNADATAGVITVTLTWGDQPDVDLHVIEPGGEHVYWREPFGRSGYLDFDDRDGRGPEHYFVACEDLEPGTYEIDVNYFSGHAPETAVVQVRGGLDVRTYQVHMRQAVSYSGDSNRALRHRIANIVVTADGELYRLRVSDP